MHDNLYLDKSIDELVIKNTSEKELLSIINDNISDVMLNIKAISVNRETNYVTFEATGDLEFNFRRITEGNVGVDEEFYHGMEEDIYVYYIHKNKSVTEDCIGHIFDPLNRDKDISDYQFTTELKDKPFTFKTELNIGGTGLFNKNNKSKYLLNLANPNNQQNNIRFFFNNLSEDIVDYLTEFNFPKVVRLRGLDVYYSYKGDSRIFINNDKTYYMHNVVYQTSNYFDFNPSSKDSINELKSIVRDITNDHLNEIDKYIEDILKLYEKYSKISSDLRESIMSYDLYYLNGIVENSSVINSIVSKVLSEHYNSSELLGSTRDLDQIKSIKASISDITIKSIWNEVGRLKDVVIDKSNNSEIAYLYTIYRRSNSTEQTNVRTVLNMAFEISYSLKLFSDTLNHYKNIIKRNLNGTSKEN